MSMTGNTSKKQQLKIESGQTPPPPPTTPPWLERETGLPAVMRNLGEQASQSNLLFGAPAPGTPRESSTIPQLLKSFFTGMPAERVGTSPSPDPSVSQTPMFTDGRVMDAIQASQMDTGQIPYASAGGQAGPTRADIAAQIAAQLGIGAGGGGGAARPDYSAYRAALTDQAQQINAQIQAMYNALGEEAGANVGRIQDIYGGASTGIGDVYDSAAANVADAYGSSQQQATDQLARLGIEAAAPAVVNPMALSQAEALSGLEQGRAGGQAATERFGSAASGFGSQMAQVAQQQGTEMNTAVLNALQNRLMDSLAAEQAGAGGGGGGGMSVSDRLRLAQYADEVYNRDVLGQVPLEEREFALREAQTLAEPTQQARSLIFDTLTDLTTRGINGRLLSIDDAKLITADNMRRSGYPDSFIAPLLAEY